MTTIRALGDGNPSWRVGYRGPCSRWVDTPGRTQLDRMGGTGRGTNRRYSSALRVWRRVLVFVVAVVVFFDFLATFLNPVILPIDALG